MRTVYAYITHESLNRFASNFNLDLVEPQEWSNRRIQKRTEDKRRVQKKTEQKRTEENRTEENRTEQNRIKKKAEHTHKSTNTNKQ